MIKIVRQQTEAIRAKLQPGKVVVITGARCVGKTTMVNMILEAEEVPFLVWNGNDISVHDRLANRSAERYCELLGPYRLLFIDEAYRIPDIGLKIRLMIDEIPGLRVIITGSASFDAFRETCEVLAGRMHTFQLYGISEIEFDQVYSEDERRQRMEDRLVFGSYPELLQLQGRDEKKDYLNELVSGYLLRDLLASEQIRNPGKILDLLRWIVHFTGEQISMQDLGNRLLISKNTVERYLSLLERIFVLYKIEPFSGYLEKEVSKASRWYFLDNGIRNAVIGNFHPVDLRHDAQKLWENYMVSERLKFLVNNQMKTNTYYWRMYNTREVDWMEERDGSLYGFDFKYTETRGRPPGDWLYTFYKAMYKQIHPDNYRECLVMPPPESRSRILYRQLVLRLRD